MSEPSNRGIKRPFNNESSDDLLKPNDIQEVDMDGPVSEIEPFDTLILSSDDEEENQEIQETLNRLEAENAELTTLQSRLDMDKKERKLARQRELSRKREQLREALSLKESLQQQLEALDNSLTPGYSIPKVKEPSNNKMSKLTDPRLNSINRKQPVDFNNNSTAITAVPFSTAPHPTAPYHSNPVTVSSSSSSTRATHLSSVPMDTNLCIVPVTNNNSEESGVADIQFNTPVIPLEGDGTNWPNADSTILSTMIANKVCHRIKKSVNHETTSLIKAEIRTLVNEELTFAIDQFEVITQRFLRDVVRSRIVPEAVSPTSNRQQSSHNQQRNRRPWRLTRGGGGNTAFRPNRGNQDNNTSGGNQENTRPPTGRLSTGSRNFKSFVNRENRN